MPFLEREQVYSQFKRLGSNSSHFVWLIANLRFFQTTQGWIFGFIRVGKVTLFALEPLIPGAPLLYTDEHQTLFQEAWAELNRTIPLDIIAFVAVYEPFLTLLHKNGFQTLKIGKEPWISLETPLAAGNSAKGVRAAKNQALRAGVHIEEWPSAELQRSLTKQKTLQELLSFWKSSRWLSLAGFLNKVDPFAFIECRRYFVALNAIEQVEAFIVVTPVPGIAGYFLEDLIATPHSTRGVGDLLTLEVLETLKREGAKMASLGVVSVNSMDSNSCHGFSKVSKKCLHGVSRLLTLFYNFNGMEVFRKRYKPSRWENIYLAVKGAQPEKPVYFITWLQVLLAILLAFQPRLTLSPAWFKTKAVKFFKRTPIAVTLAPFILFLFAKINHFGSLPDWALSKYGFSAQAPLSEWVFRSITSDLLYFSPEHFWIWGTAYIVLLAWTEKTHSKLFSLSFFILISIFDDFINYACIIRPFYFLQRPLYENLISQKDVGGSLVMVALAGLQICEFRKNREIYFALGAVGLVFGYVFISIHFHSFILNINHFLFLSLGYIIGKLNFEYRRSVSRKASKGKTPIAQNSNAFAV